MRHTKFAIAAMALTILAGCGGSSPEAGDQTLRVKFNSQVSFGDSLSDVGSYNVGAIAALKGGKFTINGDNTAISPTLTGRNWTELVAAQLGLPAPCAAMTGLDGTAPGFSVPRKTNAGCFGYAQGGARVTEAVGPGNIATGAATGFMTVPVVTQVANHLAAVGGKFKGDELVLVMAGGNDVLFLLSKLNADATAAGTAAGATAYFTSLISQLAAGATNPATAAQAIGGAVATARQAAGATQTSITQAAIGTAAAQPGNTAVLANAGAIVTKATADATAAGAKAGADFATANGPTLVKAMSDAGTQLVSLVKNQIIANGANYVTVNNLPDVATTPSGRARSAEIRTLIDAMVGAYNTALTSGLGSEPKVVIVDVYAVSHDQSMNPGPYGLTNVSEPACDLSAAKNPIGSSIVCNGSNLISGDISHYSFADEVHPTPFNNLLLARYVSRSLVTKGWL
ncbi:esterase [Duganella sp. Leaf126]|uniref:SGNH/GDSL hydrolase family protein n=1 Tax=Duganella sp. Leaf126 TaxID=1736266 RepID=UPI0007012A26|nr:SGNH/GDSL hydrolase family protein [Duganella sp. Leaf126]KQQ47459.1 esterase [Duganella sp. Leaf126]